MERNRRRDSLGGGAGRGAEVGGGAARASPLFLWTVGADRAHPRSRSGRRGRQERKKTRAVPETFTLTNGRAQWQGKAASLAGAILRADRARFDLRGVVLPGVTLEGAALNMLGLSGTQLSGAAMMRSELILVDLIGADLAVANFLCANLADGDLSGANAGGAHFEGANLHGTQLRCTNLERANVKLAVMTGADLTGTNLSGVTGLGLCQLHEADPKAIQKDLSAQLARLRGLSGRASDPGPDLQRGRGRCRLWRGASTGPVPEVTDPSRARAGGGPDPGGNQGLAELTLRTTGRTR